MSEKKVKSEGSVATTVEHRGKEYFVVKDEVYEAFRSLRTVGVNVKSESAFKSELHQEAAEQKRNNIEFQQKLVDLKLRQERAIMIQQQLAAITPPQRDNRVITSVREIIYKGGSITDPNLEESGNGEYDDDEFEDLDE